MSLTRRQFLRSSMIGLAGISVIPGLSQAATANNNGEIRLGFIGLGQQAMSLLSGFINIPNVSVVAGADVYDIKRERFKKRVTNYYLEKGFAPNIEMFENYKDLLKRDDIDAVVIATPDHWHSTIAIAACNAGKDVYLEKPLTFTIQEGKDLRKAVRDNNRILQVGSQQRSDLAFEYAARLARGGSLGNIKEVKACVGEPPKPYDLPKQQVPAGLNWDMWLGPLTSNIHYNAELNPIISIDPEVREKGWGGWRWYKETGGGYSTDWGAHMFDIAQWGLGMDKSGPVEIIPKGYKGAKFLTFKYDNGVVMTEEPFNEKVGKGVKFIGDKGWVEVSRGHYLASDPAFDFKRMGKDEGAYETGKLHLTTFINSVRTRKEPNVPVEIGHRTCTICTLANIATDLQRPVKWNPKTETFVNDKEAEAHMLNGYTHRAGF